MDVSFFCIILFCFSSSPMIVGSKHAKKMAQAGIPASPAVKAGVAVTAGAGAVTAGAADLGGVGTTGNANNFICGLCGVTAPTAASLEIHLIGQKHKKKLEAADKLAESPFRYVLVLIYL